MKQRVFQQSKFMFFNVKICCKKQVLSELYCKSLPEININLNKKIVMFAFHASKFALKHKSKIAFEEFVVIHTNINFLRPSPPTKSVCARERERETVFIYKFHVKMCLSLLKCNIICSYHFML